MYDHALVIADLRKLMVNDRPYAVTLSGAKGLCQN